ncbi:hypothetical protein TeGR_g9534 [Tetraparma gracilis]|uniref:Uncharacterized protein n=1 Tax=Tetraparma gracilis TaxID=2962635 RepID=A0ABQ6N9L9_9STRA|nr:hypothetical protein TeGR_g9534 [Tetraparma gracilis]
MSEAVMYTGADPTEDEDGETWGEWEGDAEVTDVTINDGLTEIKDWAFQGCTGLPNLSFLKDSTITTVGQYAFAESGIIILLGMEDVRKIGDAAFYACKDLRTIEGLGCEEMGSYCFGQCTLLQSMKGWPASMTVIPYGTFYHCTGMTTVDCDLAHVTSIGANAFFGCTSLLPPSLSKYDADPAAVLAHLKRKAFLETPAGVAELENAARAAELENAAQAAELEIAARAAEDSLLAELDAEDAAKKGGKKKKKKASGKKGAQQAEPADWRTDFERYVQSDTMRGVDQRKRQRNLEEEAARETTEDTEAQIVALGLDLAPLPAPDELAETAEDIEAAIAALGPPPSFSPAPPAAPGAPAETAEDIEAQIAALGLPPDSDPDPPHAPEPAAALDASIETLLATVDPPAPAPQSLKEMVRSLLLEVCGEDMPAGIGMAAAVALVEEELLGGVREGGIKERVRVLEKKFYG